MTQGINPEVGYEFDAFRLNGGLDLTSPKIDAPKGSLLDCLNRDTIDRIGYRRINGFEPYDGRVTPAQTKYYVLRATDFSGSVEMDGSLTDYQPGTLLSVDDDADTVFGIVVLSQFIAVPSSSNIYDIVYARINEDAEPTSSESILPHGGGDSFTVSSKFSYAGDDALDTVTDMNGFNTILRNRIGSLRDTPIGLHWYRDQLYAVVDDATIYFEKATGTTPIVTNSILTKDGGASTARVLSVTLTTGDWSGVTEGMMTIEVLTGTWGSSGTVSVSSPTNATTITLRAAESADSKPLYASLYRARNEQQAIDDGDTPADAGWSRIDHGWEIDYSNGFSETGGLVLVSRGSDNNFEFESGSSTDDALEIINGTNINGIGFAPRRAASFAALTVEDGNPGWKTNADNSVFAESSALKTAVHTDGSNYAYANFYVVASGSGLGGYPASGGGYMVASDSSTGDPTGYATKPADVGTVVYDTDWYSTQIRAPLILKDFSAAAAAIPAGSIIVGAKVDISYDTRYFAEALLATGRIADPEDKVERWLTSGAISWAGSFVTSTTSTQATATGNIRYALVDVTSGGKQSSTAPAGPTSERTLVGDFVPDQTATLGGATDIWGLTGVTRNTLLDGNFALAIFGQVVSDTLFDTGLTNYIDGGSPVAENIRAQIRAYVDHIVITFYYTTPSARYYVGDGAGNVCSVDVVYYVNRDGSFTTGSAEGSLQFTNLLTDVTGTKRTVETGDEFFVSSTDAALGSNPVLTVDTDAEYNGIPSRDRLITNASRYQFITANFFGRDEWDGFYGVSGAGRAFSFSTYNADNSLDGSNEDYIIKVTTSTLDEAGDTPRHIAFHHYALALGFRSGIVRFSVPGEPENFDGVKGAAEVGVGDKVTGLLGMKGTTLGVFCENSIWGIAGTDTDNYQTQALAPYTGAIEYSVVDMGIPVYCDNRGISTLEQSEKYGNFTGRRLSYNVTPFILPRMIRNNAQFSGQGIICALPFRADNQYLVFFKDGKVLVMTMNPDGQVSLTYSTYYIGSGTSGNFLAPFAWSAQVDDRGIDRIHVSHYSPLSTVSDANGLKVYEINRGWGFAGEPIPNYYTCNWYYKDPFTYTTLKKIRIDGLTYGVSSCRVYLAKEYDTTFSTAYTDANLRVGQVGGTQVYSTDPVPASVMANVTERGRSITFKVEGSNTAPIPPDIHQIILPHFDAGGKIDS